jgi:hypothetical protein
MILVLNNLQVLITSTTDTSGTSTVYKSTATWYFEGRTTTSRSRACSSLMDVLRTTLTLLSTRRLVCT